MPRHGSSLAAALALLAGSASTTLAQRATSSLVSSSTTSSARDIALPPDSVLARALTFRSIGPAHMGGRIVDIAVADNSKAAHGGHIGTVIYIGAATGGVYRSTNAGVSWTPVFDSVRTGGVGAVAVAPSDPDVLWVGTGEPNNMRSSSWGTGVYKSTDGAATWSKAMLPHSQHIGRIVIDPRDPDVVYVAALGPLWAPGGDRGLYKTTDGGKTWTNTKSISKYTGFTDIVMDPSDPDVLYAAALERERREYGFLPAGPESGIYKTTDAGKTWTQLTNGLPTGDVGRIGLSVCRAKPATVYAIVHAKGNQNGLYRSDDAGASWHHMNGTDGTAWYYSQVRCDPADPEHVIRLGASSQESYDGGKTWSAWGTGPGVHGDHHALWINPDAPDQMILGNDGGLNISWDRGKTWSHSENFVAAQFYTVAVDDAQPFYNVCGGLQDNFTWCGPSRTRNSYGPTGAEWYRLHGGDGFFAVPDPLDRNLIYAEMQSGGVVRFDLRTGEEKNIKPVPAPGEKHRYNWSAPILPSKHDPKTVYIAANYLFRSNDRGDTWQTISPDLTRDIDWKKLPMRGAIPDSTALGRNEGTAEFGNITSLDESPLKAGLLVAGTDDGLIQVTRDGGRTWHKTDRFPGVPDTTYVSKVSFSNAHEGTIYATFDGHRSNDFTPYVYESDDYGETWRSITGDLPSGGATQVVREHPRQPNLLFAGTEFGVFFTTDRGTHWTQLTHGIPGVPVYDLVIQPRANDLVVGTHGRGIYILDDVTPLEDLARAKQAATAYLFPVENALLFQPNSSLNSGMGTSGFAGENPDPGTRISYMLTNVAPDAKVTLAVVDGSGTVIRELPTSKEPGMYRTTWDMRVGPPYTGPADTTPARGARGGQNGNGANGAAGANGANGAAANRGRGAPSENGAGAPGGGGFRRGPTNEFHALPGQYRARLTVASGNGAPVVLEQSFALTKDPMIMLSDAELKQLYAFRLSVVRAQTLLRDQQTALDSLRREYALVKRAADSSSSKLTPALRTQLSAAGDELTAIGNTLGSAGRGGRGGFRGAGGGAAGGGRGGRGGAAASDEGAGASSGAGAASGAANGSDDEQNATATVAPTETLQAQLGTTTEMLTATFNPNPRQRATMQTLPKQIDTQAARIARMKSTTMPALIAALHTAGIEVPPARR